ncbi:sugar phosphate isomerase/epimerase family protein [Limibacillus sp. MBR-115]|jgi:sugar phosphate isomerase/epimerase|uniref:sugar phosphate isomerase/epimerase family protein n=1 Tax=Limibacillus sp. MBR-115 TaxID=3156465 RepID=UPI0033974463
MDIALVTDELSADPQTAIELGLEWGVRHFELRGYFADRVPFLSGYQHQRLKRLVRDHGVEITAVSPGLFKMPFSEKTYPTSNLTWMDSGFFERWSSLQAELERHVTDLLPASIDFALEYGAKYLISFSFHRAGHDGGVPPEGVIETLQQAAEKVEAAGLELLIETEEGFWADTGQRSGALISAVRSPALGINWDPANSFCEGDVPYPEGYSHLHQYVRNVHFKDARRLSNGSTEFVENGEIDWDGQIQALVRDGYKGAITVEPHLEPRVPAVRRSLARLKIMIESAEAGEKSSY